MDLTLIDTNTILERDYVNFASDFGISEEHCLSNAPEKFEIANGPIELQNLLFNDANLLHITYDYEIMAEYFGWWSGTHRHGLSWEPFEIIICYRTPPDSLFKEGLS